MRCGILIIGSLFWDEQRERASWRERLDIGCNMSVSAPIYYGRKSTSRGDTYTMTFRAQGPFGTAILVPCKCEIMTIDCLKAEAEALWRAESPKTCSAGAIGSRWGCVGAMFRSDVAGETLAEKWKRNFRNKPINSVSVVNDDGILDIDWPNRLDGRPADFDIILATATEPENEPPTAPTVAEAWIDQSCGHENYFFNNVKHGIRTPGDLESWRSIEERASCWLGPSTYEEAIDILRAETQAAES